ncbi:putative zinc cadmium resistance protein [Phaeoacremonium minimum UCRPA7]|uniref:Putative zinc cadmium resistance protein n=1 Tax=Phaeoacremonium minimum (strain UCR-PA7) TaxID=1286976 RepID=R8BN45_PHAM7|nr:putative zinc cadmium resistance protein [Phaeoacremonium minimum UCRPA7]EOO00813.1 putative zinc cadmium resistance protein [Phaeoacremonium minimum UCRPA7]
MAWSKSTRISIMLAIDVAFFLLELTVGFMVHSLALMADAFHMLNDIISLLVGLWAVVVARKATSDKYSYGWLRAEILGAFFNAVFLIALCVSIILEALTRFIDPPEIGNAKLILIVGSLGLGSNLVGFLVLGGHGHSHGGHDDHDHEGHGHDHDHGHEHTHQHDDLHAAEEGRAIPEDAVDGGPADENGRIADLLPEAAVARFNAPSTQSLNSRHITFDRSDGARSEVIGRCESRASQGSRGRQRRRANSLRHTRLTSIEDLSIHPASFRQEIIEASRPQLNEESDESGSDESPDENPIVDDEATEDTPLIKGNGTDHRPYYGGRSTSRRSRRDSHQAHNHNRPKKPSSGGGHGHNHGDMGMNAMVLHVLGDALGNVGVIATALIIWLTDWPGRFYADPAVSLFITLIILKSAIPLTKATSKILLQATPEHIEVNDIREDIQALPGVVSCHHIHIWQLSDTNIVASLHIQVEFPISEAGGEKYMELAKKARKCLHAYGIHSATIQPEFCLDKTHDHLEVARYDGTTDGSVDGMSCARGQGKSCLLDCVDDCVAKGCCSGTEASPPGSSHGSHAAQSEGHSEHDGHTNHH